MVQGYSAELKKLHRKHGFEFVRAGKGDHEIWKSPHSERPIVVDGRIMSRHTANAILKQAGIGARF